MWLGRIITAVEVMFLLRRITALLLAAEHRLGTANGDNNSI